MKKYTIEQLRSLRASPLATRPADLMEMTAPRRRQQSPNPQREDGSNDDQSVAFSPKNEKLLKKEKNSNIKSTGSYIDNKNNPQDRLDRLDDGHQVDNVDDIHKVNTADNKYSKTQKAVKLDSKQDKLRGRKQKQYMEQQDEAEPEWMDVAVNGNEKIEMEFSTGMDEMQKFKLEMQRLAGATASGVAPGEFDDSEAFGDLEAFTNDETFANEETFGELNTFEYSLPAQTMSMTSKQAETSLMGARNNSFSSKNSFLPVKDLQQALPSVFENSPPSVNSMHILDNHGFRTFPANDSIDKHILESTLETSIMSSEPPLSASLETGSRLERKESKFSQFFTQANTTLQRQQHYYEHQHLRNSSVNSHVNSHVSTSASVNSSPSLNSNVNNADIYGQSSAVLYESSTFSQAVPSKLQPSMLSRMPPASPQHAMSEEEVLSSMGVVRQVENQSPNTNESDMNRILQMLTNAPSQLPSQAPSHQPARPPMNTSNRPPLRSAYGQQQSTNQSQDPLSQLSAMLQNTIQAKKNFSNEQHRYHQRPPEIPPPNHTDFQGAHVPMHQHMMGNHPNQNGSYPQFHHPAPAISNVTSQQHFIGDASSINGVGNAQNSGMNRGINGNASVINGVINGAVNNPTNQSANAAMFHPDLNYQLHMRPPMPPSHSFPFRPDFN